MKIVSRPAPNLACLPGGIVMIGACDSDFVRRTFRNSADPVDIANAASSGSFVQM